MTRLIRDGIERATGTEALRFVRKDKAKLKVVLGLYALSLKDRETGKVARASYFFLRHLDDLLDGEVAGVTNDPVSYADSYRSQIETREFDPDSRIAKLAQFALMVLERKAKPTDNPSGEFIRVIDAMTIDYERRQERCALSSDALLSQYSNTLDPSFNLLLIGMDSDVRAEDAPTLSPSLSRLYSVRDIAKDWQQGIINVPRETLTAAELTTQATYEQLKAAPIINEWVEQEVNEASANLTTVQQQLTQLPERLTRRILNGLTNSALKITN